MSPKRGQGNVMAALLRLFLRALLFLSHSLRLPSPLWSPCVPQNHLPAASPAKALSDLLASAPRDGRLNGMSVIPTLATAPLAV